MDGGLLEPGITYQLALAGLSLTSAASAASVLGSLEPAIVPLIAWLLFRQRPRQALVVIVAGATIGSTMVSFSASGDGRSLVGDLLVVLSVITTACYVVLADRYVEQVRPLPAALTQQLWALGIVVSGAAITLAVTGGPAWQGGTEAVVLAAMSGVLNYALPFWLYLSALTRLPITSAAAYLTLIPVFGVVLAVVLLGESVTATQGLGAAMVVVSLAIGSRIDRPERPDEVGRRPSVAAAPIASVDPIATVDPEASDDDFGALNDAVGDAQIVGLGEPHPGWRRSRC